MVEFRGLHEGSLSVVWHLLLFATGVCLSAMFHMYRSEIAYLSGMACTKPPSAVNIAPAEDPSFPTGVSTVLRKLRGIPVTRT